MSLEKISKSPVQEIAAKDIPGWDDENVSDAEFAKNMAEKKYPHIKLFLEASAAEIEKEKAEWIATVEKMQYELQNVRSADVSQEEILVNAEGKIKSLINQEKVRKEAVAAFERCDVLSVVKNYLMPLLEKNFALRGTGNEQSKAQINAILKIIESLNT